MRTPKEYKKVCIICGKEFIAHNHVAKLCSDDCKRERNKQIYYNSIERTRKRKEEEKQRKKNEVEPAWVIKDKAEKLGMSYGYYVALFENNGR